VSGFLLVSAANREADIREPDISPVPSQSFGAAL
jgi:hypothetical protein